MSRRDPAPSLRDDPLGPVKIVLMFVGIPAAVLILGVALSPLWTHLGPGESISTCLEAPSSARVLTDPSLAAVAPVEVAPDVRVHASQVKVCQTNASFWVRAGAAAPSTLTQVTLVISLLLLVGFVFSARRSLFAPRAALFLQLLGWFLIVVAIVGGFVVTASLEAALRAMLGPGPEVFTLDDYAPWPLLLVGLGVLTFARMVTQAGRLQDDVDATI